MTGKNTPSGNLPEKTAVGGEDRRRFLAHLPTIVLWGILVLLLGTLVHVAITFQFQVDEFEAIHTAWKIAQGERIYVDFFQHHHPWMYYCLAPMIGLLGEGVATLVAIRLGMVIVVMGTLGITAFVARAAYGKGVALFALLLMCTKYQFAFYAFDVRPDNPQTLFGLLSILLFLRYYDVRRPWILALSATSLAVSFVLLQKAVFLGFLMGAVLLASTIKREIRLRDLSMFFAVFVLSAVVLLSPVLLTAGPKTD